MFFCLCETVLLSKHEKELKIAFSECCILTCVTKRWIFVEPTKEGWKPISWDDPVPFSKGTMPKELIDPAAIPTGFTVNSCPRDDDHALFAASHMSAWKSGPLAINEYKIRRPAFFQIVRLLVTFSGWRVKRDHPAIDRFSASITDPFGSCICIYYSWIVRNWFHFEYNTLCILLLRI